MKFVSALPRLFLCLGVAALAYLSACAVATPRPVQEISNADAALKAARDLHADTLVPELYRAASENFFEARRQYRLKNFDKAKNRALLAMKYAERAEYIAYTKGGATPEVASKLQSAEGASADPEESLQKAHELHQDQEEEKQRFEKEAAERRRSEEPVLTEEEQEPNIEAPAQVDLKKTPEDEKKETDPAKGKTGP